MKEMKEQAEKHTERIARLEKQVKSLVEHRAQCRARHASQGSQLHTDTLHTQLLLRTLQLVQSRNRRSHLRVIQLILLKRSVAPVAPAVTLLTPVSFTKRAEL
jgi:ABC-type Fe3+-citrate transport system substrate-binding protein